MHIISVLQATPISPRCMTKIICDKEEFEKHYGIEVMTTPTSPRQTTRMGRGEWNRDSAREQHCIVGIL